MLLASRFFLQLWESLGKFRKVWESSGKFGKVRASVTFCLFFRCIFAAMKILKKKTTIILIGIAALLGVGTIVMLVYSRRKKNPNESVSQSIASAVSSAVTSGYKPESFPLKKGMFGENIRLMQNFFIEMGHNLGASGADGKFGDKTLTAVRSFYIDPVKTEVTQKEWEFMRLAYLK